MKQPLLVADLFSGAGGMSHGFAVHGAYQVIAAVDRQLAKPSNYGKSSTSCNDTYAANIGIRPLDADLFELDERAWMRELNLETRELDVLISCAPCTGFSPKNQASRLIDDRRNSLVARTADFVAALEPSVFVMENVKELLVGRNTHHYTHLHEQLQRMGYHVQAQVHDLSHYGLPQLRKRALIVASKRHDGSAFSLPRREPVTVRDAIAHLPPLTAGQTDTHDPMHTCPAHNERSMARIRAIPHDGGSWADLLGTKHEHLLTAGQRRPDRKTGSFPDAYGRLWWDQPARTITRECGHPGNGRYLHPEQDRMLSVREMALIQGFPPSYHFHGSLAARYNQIGDAVPPIISTQIAAYVHDLLS